MSLKLFPLCVWLRAGSLVLAASLPLASLLAACGDPASSSDSPDDEGEDKPVGSKDAGNKDGSTRDAGKQSEDEPVTADDDDDDAKPVKDAGKPAAPEASVPKDAGAGPKDAGSPTTVGDAGPSVSGVSAEELESLRKVCVDEINMYRATLSLPALERPTLQHESCSDQGAKKDGDSKQAHGSAGAGNPCATPGMRTFPGFQSQNTCPGYPVGARGAATIADALKGCLKQMWAEGEPPGGEKKCLDDYFAGNTACFLAHGHYINMKNTFKKVSCGFYDMGKSTYWMNQDFL